MNWLFIHQNFPGQYAHVIRYLVARGEQVVGIGQTGSQAMYGVHKLDCAPLPLRGETHEFVREFEQSVQNGLAVARICADLKQQGFTPDIIIGHNGWGETLYVKDVWPGCPLLGYFEFFYHSRGADVDFDPEFSASDDIGLRLRIRNAVNLIGLDAADAGQTATRWQQSRYPSLYRDKISVIHEGIDTGVVRPDPAARIWLEGGLSLGHGDEVITYGTRNLEPYRGFHVFMRALPEVLARRPNVQVLILGGDGVSYGTWPANGATWRQRMLDEMAGSLDLARVHFLGRVPFRQYLTVLQVSAVHVYFTYPFVLSWSLLEAMAAGCVVVASRTAPVEEVVRDGENGHLVGFFDRDGLVERLCTLLEDDARERHIRVAARQTIVDTYGLEQHCLPAYMALVADLLAKSRPLD